MHMRYGWIVRRHASIRAIAILFAVAGCAHFAIPAVYERVMPSWVPYPRAMVLISGAAEILGAVGMMTPSARKAASYGLIALLVAVFPANIEMLNAARASHAPWFAIVLLIARLPLQPLLMWWIWRVGIAYRRPA